MRNTGTYVKQSTGYRAFVPTALPPNPELAMDEEMQFLLSKADRSLGRLDGSIQTLPNPDLFVLMYVRKEAVLSSQIEGTQASLNDLLAAESELFESSSSDDVDEVLNYVAAMNHGLKRISELPVSMRLIREIHEKLMQGVRGQYLTPGEFRQSQNWSGPPGCGLADALFVPPPPHLVGQALSDLEKFIHDSTPMPDLIKIGLIHSHFETIHPFLDGNGRTGRLLTTFLLCEKEILQQPVLYISHYLKKNRDVYYDMLQKTRESGNYEDWIKFFLLGISEVSSEATETARSIVSLREDHRERITRNMGKSAGSCLQLLEYMFKRPYFNVMDVENYLNITYVSANNIVKKLMDEELISEITGQKRHRRFSYKPYIALFQ